MSRVRSTYWDVWKGIAILAVVAIHCSATLINPVVDVTNWSLEMVFRQFICFPVPIFLAFAGYFSGANKNYVFDQKYIYSRLLRIVPPYLVWTFIYVLLKSPTDFLKLDAILADIFLGLGIGIGYFVLVLIQFVILTPFLAKIKDDNSHLILMAALTIMALCISYSVRIFQPTNAWAQFPLYAILFLVWYPFYHIGFYAAKKKWIESPIFIAWSLRFFLLYLFFIAASIIESKWLAKQGLINFSLSQIKVTSFIASVFLFLFIVANYKSFLSKKWNVFVWLGVHSYAIYLMHLLLLSFSLFLANYLSIVNLSQRLYFCFLFFSVILLNSLAILIAKRFFNKTMLSRFLGI